MNSNSFFYCFIIIGLLGMPPGMVAYGAPMAFPGGPHMLPMMQPRFR